ncbi:uncharacterized protein PpBr36_06654 [Pyricularia pennisetigena]|uniref:uncharacterized protein n=1 Tax=Pyricularia pennisetigena TaxID=1578925 RepID=UPI00114F426D|nr:uncharacterized protein PpBr36_06654 [Pyricularia pennisetigena]TLS23155.1 hypothetical protein PpBr36_06654 [Pyricularia pennisetigena]
MFPLFTASSCLDHALLPRVAGACAVAHEAQDSSSKVFVIKGLGEREPVLLRWARGRHASREGWARWGDGVRDSSDLGCLPGWSWYAGLQKLDRLSMRVLAASEVLRKPAGGQWRDSMGVEVGGANRNYDITCGMNGIGGRSITCRSFALSRNN